MKHLFQSIFFNKNVVNITITYIISNILRIANLNYFSKHGDIIINRSQNNVFLCAKILRNRQASDLICTWRIWMKLDTTLSVSQIRKYPHFFSYEVSNSMLVFLRIHLRVSSLWTFLFRRHDVCYPSRKFFASNSIYNKARSFISFKARSSGFLLSFTEVFQK